MGNPTYALIAPNFVIPYLLSGKRCLLVRDN